MVKSNPKFVQLSVILFMLFQGSCSRDRKLVHAFPEDLTGQRRSLAPGSYWNNVEVILSDGNGYRFHTQIELHENKCQLDAFDPDAGIKLFRINEDASNGTAQLTIYIPKLETARTAIEEVYMKLRPFFFRGLDLDAASLLRDYDENGVPRKLVLQTSQYKLALRVNSYQLR